MVSDPYGEAKALAAALRSHGQVDWASKLDEIIAAGATASEILMGLRWTLEQLLTATELDDATAAQARRLSGEIDRLLS